MNYTFLNLSPIEFETLCRDLMQVELKNSLETFKEGKDQGIDIRGWINQTDNLIIQCKRYSELSDLITNLKKEVLKVQTLNPKRYMLCTSVQLSPANKKTISDLFAEHLFEADIFGNQDLNKLLSENPQVERKHYKLWLASTNILQSIINNKVTVQSAIEQEILEKISKIYVSNDSYSEALEIIKKEKFVILSGNPGVGKTTLGRVLSYEFIKNGYELVVAVNSIKEAYDGYSEDINQVILFDDFLGRSILDGRYPLNEEHQLITFIEKMANAKNKILILTTREYILNQAKAKYEVIKSSEIDIAKCVVDVSKYTKLIKAKILYNHLFFAILPEEFIEKIISSKIYLEIVNHQNYSPRIIETIVKKRDWEVISSQEYPKKIIQYFDKPYSIWESAYEIDINSISKVLLLVLVSLGTPVLKEDLRKAVDSFAKLFASKYAINVTDFSFNASIRELHNTFITTSLDSYGQVAVEFQNPSIYDFLVDYLDNNLGLQEDIIASAIFYNQLFEVFTSSHDRKIDDILGFLPSLIPLKDNRLTNFQNRILNDFNDLGFAEITKTRYVNGKIQWNYRNLGVYRKLDLLVQRKHQLNEPIKSFVTAKFNTVAVPKDVKIFEHSNYFNLIRNLEVDASISPKEMMEEFLQHVSLTFQLKEFTNFQKVFENAYTEYVSSDDSFFEKLDTIIKREAEEADKDNYQDTIKDIEWIAATFEYDANKEIEELTMKKDEHDDFIISNIDNIDFDDAREKPIYNPQTEEEAIIELFESLTS